MQHILGCFASLLLVAIFLYKLVNFQIQYDDFFHGKIFQFRPKRSLGSFEWPQKCWFGQVLHFQRLLDKSRNLV